MFFLLVFLVKLSVLAKWLPRNTPLKKPIRGEGIVSRKPRQKNVYNFLDLLYCFIVLLCICVVSCPYVIYYPTVMARYSLFVLKVPLNPKQTNKQTKNFTFVWSVAAAGRTVCAVSLPTRHLQRHVAGTRRSFRIPAAVTKKTLDYHMQGWNKLWKTGRAKNFAPENFFPAVTALFQFASPLLGAHALYCPPVEAQACCDRNESESYRPTISVDTVLNSRHIRYFSANFSRTTGSEAIEKWKGKDIFSPLASKSGGAFALPAIQLVPPLSTYRLLFNSCTVPPLTHIGYGRPRSDLL